MLMVTVKEVLQIHVPMPVIIVMFVINGLS